jgi:hypothetical protein
MAFGYEFDVRILLRAIGFSTQRRAICGLQLSKSDVRILLQAIGFHPEAKYIWAFGYPSMLQDSSSS